MRKLFLGTVVISTITTVGATQVDRPLSEPSVQAPQTAPAAVSNGLVFADGIVEGRSRESELRFEIPGRLVAVDVSAGSIVRAGDELARVAAETHEHQLAEAEANLAIAKAERCRLSNGACPETRAVFEARVQAAKVEVQRAARAHDRALGLPKNAISRQTLDDRAGDLEAAEARLAVALRQELEANAPARSDELAIATARVELAETRVAQAKSMLAKTIIRAPYDGLVTRVQAEPGELVGPERIQPIITVVDDSEIRVRAFVEEMDAARVAEGMPAEVVADGDLNVRHRGVVIECTPSMTEKLPLRNNAHERFDVKVREVVIELDLTAADGQLVLGLPVDVTVSAAAGVLRSQEIRD